jgi:hypothetical protein
VCGDMQTAIFVESARILELDKDCIMFFSLVLSLPVHV